jgi:ABC-type branched-subunit amino acid transport system substrate-binding protein
LPPPVAAGAAQPIKIGFPILLSGSTAVYGEPILKGARPTRSPS